MQIWKYDDFLKVSFRYEWGGGGVFCFGLFYFICFFVKHSNIYSCV